VRLIWTSLVTTAALLVGYAIALPWVPAAGRGAAETGHATNVTRLQRYIYERLDAPVVIVGTSLAARLPPELLPADAVNLSQSGGSALTGLRVIVRSGAAPKLVLIESNLLTHPFDRSSVDALFTPVVSQVRGWAPILREDNRPISAAVILTAISVEYGLGRLRYEGWLGGSGWSTSGEVRPASSPEDVFGAIFAQIEETYGQRPSDRELREMTGQLDEMVGTLLRRGCRVAFFEMPVHPSLISSPLLRANRETILAHFSDRGLPYLTPGSAGGLQTTDGAHLDSQAAAMVARALARVVGAMGIVTQPFPGGGAGVPIPETAG